MSQSKKKRADNRSVEPAASAKAIDRDRKRTRRTRFIIAGVVITLIPIIIGVSLYISSAPFRLTIIIVDNTSIRMDYFLKRVRLAGADPMFVLGELTNEQLIKLEAPGYVGEVSLEDIDQGLRRIASGESETISESEFKEWYRQQLNETRLSDAEYKEITRTSILAARLQEYLAERVPTVAEQVHVHFILLETYEEAVKIKARLEDGEDFAELAREVSLDAGTREKGGDLGWWPRGVLLPGLDSAAFNLSIGDVSEPLPFFPPPDLSEPEPEVQGYYLLMVSERAAARELEENSQGVLRSKALEDWLSQVIQFHEISFHGFNNGYDSETNAWVNWQLTKG